MRKKLLWFSSVLVSIFVALFATQVFANSDLFIRDTVSDTGVEPYSGPGPIYLSPDIWVRNEPDPNHDPHPFSTASPTWIPLPHQNPEYRDSKTGQPNYVYVRVQNRGNQPSTGTERLRLYQAKASTGLNWPDSWVDNVEPTCGAKLLHGIEITKPRKNAQAATPEERDAYRDALMEIQSDPQFKYSDGTQYWRKQNEIHAGVGNPEHGNPAFLSWHREMINRFEERLRESNPLVTLLYWDWTVDPRSGTNLFTTNFMGEGNGAVAAPLTPLRPPTLTRNVGTLFPPDCPGTEADNTVMNTNNYPTLRSNIENTPNHNCAHGYIGGGSGQISDLGTAVQDPFFFLLHGNVDRLWATWQRDGADPVRIDPIAAYGANSSNSSINQTMRPWDGNTGMAPWNGSAAYHKTSKHRSVVYPPIYDTAPLNIPILQPGQSVIVEIPWFPPDVNEFNCEGQAGHFCLLARIETNSNAPFGMSTPEGSNVGTNTRENNNIAWKNLTIVDNISEPLLMMKMGTTVRNIFDRQAIFEILLLDRTVKRRFLLPEFARTALVLPNNILKRIVAQKASMQDLKLVKDQNGRRSLLQITGKEPRFSIVMKPNETFTAQFAVEMKDKNIPRELLVEPFHFDIEQRLDLPRKFFGKKVPTTLDVGGVRFTLDFAQILKKNVKEIKMADLRLKLSPLKRKLLTKTDKSEADISHLSPGEPVDIIVHQREGDAKKMRKMVLELDGKEVATVKQTKSIRKTIRFEKPGVHTIVTRGIDEDGQVKLRRMRVLVSENIPPNAIITKPTSGDRFKLGDSIDITVETAAAFGREVRKVSLYVKDDSKIFTGLDLVRSPNYKPVETGEGPENHSFRFTPKKPGIYRFQIGAVDDKNITGVSGHIMVQVSE